MSDFIYKLNAMENAAQSEKPAQNGYADKRKAVLAYVANLEYLLAEQQALPSPDDLFNEAIMQGEHMDDAACWEWAARQLFILSPPVAKDDYAKVHPAELDPLDQDALEDMVIVPREPTEKMRSAFSIGWLNTQRVKAPVKFAAAYRAMLDAAMKEPK